MQHHPREGRRRQHHPRGATSTTPTKEEEKAAPPKRKEETAGPQEKGARQSKVVVHLGRWCWLPLLGGAAVSSLLLCGAAFTSSFVGVVLVATLGWCCFPSSPLSIVINILCLETTPNKQEPTRKVIPQGDGGRQHHPKEGSSTQEVQQAPPLYFVSPLPFFLSWRSTVCSSWMVLPSPPSFVWCCLPPPPPWNGVAFLPSSVVVKHFVLRRTNCTRTNKKGNPTRREGKAAPPKGGEEGSTIQEEEQTKKHHPEGARGKRHHTNEGGGERRKKEKKETNVK